MVKLKNAKMDTFFNRTKIKLTRLADSGAAEDDHPDPVDVCHQPAGQNIR